MDKIKIISMATTVLGAIATLASNWVEDKKIDQKITEKVAEALEKATKSAK